MKYINIQVDGIDVKDYPDFCDAYISYAEYEDGTPLTDEELDALSEDTEFVHEHVYATLF